MKSPGGNSWKTNDQFSHFWEDGDLVIYNTEEPPQWISSSVTWDIEQ